MARRGGFGSYSYGSWFPPPSVPRPAKGGIKARSQRGAFGASWWARRWVEVLESFNIGARLARGRSYARKGQVTDIRIQEGKVTAKVQGSRPRPYDVVIGVTTLTAAQWKKVATRLGEEALYAAKLLAGEIPQEVEEVFRAAGVTLFPSLSKDLKTECSCPDWSNPCKHIAAVYFLLGEEFDRDPFLIFKLRGMSREGLMELMGEGAVKPRPRARSKPKAESPAKRGGRPASRPSPPRPEPLPSDPERFWRAAAGGDAPQPPGVGAGAESGAALAQRLGGFPFWRGRESLGEVMDRSYARAAAAALEVMAGDRPSSSRPR